MEGIFPVFIDGELSGKLEVRCGGAMTEFEAHSRMREGIVRLSVYGEGKEGYLGVMVPEGDGLCIRKKLSRTAMRNFPGAIEFAERAGKDFSQGNGPLPEITAEETACAQSEAEECRTAAECETECESEGCAEAECVTEGSTEPECGNEKCEAAECGAEEESQLCWYSSPDGVLVCFDGEKSLVAFPRGDERVPTNIKGTPKTIEGCEYEVFITKNGRIVG